METERPRNHSAEVETATAAQFTGEVDPEETRSWEQVAPGQYMPRRIKGSCKGRALG